MRFFCVLVFMMVLPCLAFADTVPIEEGFSINPQILDFENLIEVDGAVADISVSPCSVTRCELAGVDRSVMFGSDASEDFTSYETIILAEDYTGVIDVHPYSITRGSLYHLSTLYRVRQLNLPKPDD